MNTVSIDDILNVSEETFDELQEKINTLSPEEREALIKKVQEILAQRVGKADRKFESTGLEL